MRYSFQPRYLIFIFWVFIFCQKILGNILIKVKKQNVKNVRKVKIQTLKITVSFLIMLSNLKTYELKTSSKRKIQKTEEKIFDFIGNKIAKKISKI